jgi:diguanylate cyclase (GGDEF)-like protein
MLARPGFPFAAVLARKGGAPLSLSRFVWIGTAVACAGFVAVAAWMADQSRTRTLQEAAASVQNLALILEKHTSRTVDGVDVLLRLVLNEGSSGRLEGAVLSQRAVDDLLWELPHIVALSLLDAGTGEPVQSFGEVHGALGAVNLDARLVHDGGADRGLHIGRPVYDRRRGSWVLGFSRRREARPGQPAAIAVAHLDLSHLQRFYEEIEIGPDGAIALIRPDGVMLARKPYNAATVGQNFSGAKLFEELARADAGTYESLSAVDGLQRIYAYRRLPEAPLVVNVSRATDAVLAPWRADGRRNLLVLTLAVAVLLVIAVLATREARRRERAEASAKEKSAFLEATLETMDQGLLMVDGDMRVRVCNRRALELLDLPPALLASKPSFHEITRFQQATDEFRHAGQDFRDWVDSGGFERDHHTYERERPNGTVLEIRTVPFRGGGAVRTYTDITERKRNERRIAHLARHDALTELPNRVLFRERLEQKLAEVERHGGRLALLCLDLDQFKAVNDTLGHGFGDALLRTVAARIRRTLRDGDTVARLGGDEFAVIQVGGDGPDAAGTLAQRLVETVGQPVVLDDNPLNVGVSVGIAMAPADGLDPDALLRCADLALYRAKGDGRGTYRFFERSMDAEIHARRDLETGLRDALSRGEFALRYQPFVDVASGAAVGFEALVRWNHPSRGVVSPAEFIAVAEDTGLIVPLGEWVLRRACADAVAWPGHVRVAVNISAAQFKGGLVQTILSALAASGLSPNRLELEITETVLMQDNESSLRVLHQLRALGVRIAMDDFGTGYSSLSYLRSFPFDQIKIDRSFVRELPHDRDCLAIVRSIVGLGTSLGIATIAEGVETEAQLAAVRDEGCTEVQGYLFGAPQPAAEASRLLVENAIRAA